MAKKKIDLSSFDEEVKPKKIDLSSFDEDNTSSKKKVETSNGEGLTSILTNPVKGVQPSTSKSSQTSLQALQSGLQKSQAGSGVDINITKPSTEVVNPISAPLKVTPEQSIPIQDLSNLERSKDIQKIAGTKLGNTEVQVPLDSRGQAINYFSEDVSKLTTTPKRNISGGKDYFSELNKINDEAAKLFINEPLPNQVVGTESLSQTPLQSQNLTQTANIEQEQRDETKLKREAIANADLDVLSKEYGLDANQAKKLKNKQIELGMSELGDILGGEDAEKIKSVEDFIGDSYYMNTKKTEAKKQGLSMEDYNYQEKKINSAEVLDLLPDDMKEQSKELFDITSKMRDFMTENGISVDSKTGELDLSKVKDERTKAYLNEKMGSYLKEYDNHQKKSFNIMNDKIVEKKSEIKNLDFLIKKGEKQLEAYTDYNDKKKMRGLIDQAKSDLDNLNGDLQDLQKGKNSFFNIDPNDIKAEFKNSKSAQSVFSALPSDMTDKEQSDVFYERLLAKNKQLAKDNNIDVSEADKMGAEWRDFLDWGGNMSLSAAEKEYFSNKKILQALAAPYLNNSSGITKDSGGFLESAKGSFSKWIQPNTEKTYSETDIARKQLETIQKEGLSKGNFGEKTKSALEERVNNIPFASMETAGEMIGTTGAIMAEMVVGGAVLSPLKGTKVIKTLGKVYDKAMDASKVLKYVKPAVTQGLEMEAIGTLFQSAEDELNFTSGAVGALGGELIGAMSKKLGSEKLAKYISSAFGSNGNKALYVLKRAGEINNRGLGEVGEEVTQELIGIYNDELRERGFWDEVSSKYGNLSDIGKLVASSYIMGSGLGMVAGENKAKEWYQSLPKEEQAIVDNIKNDINQDVANASAEVSKAKDQIIEFGTPEKSADEVTTSESAPPTLTMDSEGNIVPDETKPSAEKPTETVSTQTEQTPTETKTETDVTEPIVEVVKPAIEIVEGGDTETRYENGDFVLEDISKMTPEQLSKITFVNPTEKTQEIINNAFPAEKTVKEQIEPIKEQVETPTETPKTEVETEVKGESEVTKEQMPTSKESLQVDNLEEKKSEIEKNRQDEIKNFLESTKVVATYNGKKYPLSEQQKEEYVSIINGKYDAELKSLEQKFELFGNTEQLPTENVQTETKPSAEKETPTKFKSIADNIRKLKTTPPKFTNPETGEEFEFTKQGFDWNDLVESVAVAVEKTGDVVGSVKEYLGNQDWYNKLSDDGKKSFEKQVVDNLPKEEVVSEQEKFSAENKEIINKSKKNAEKIRDGKSIFKRFSQKEQRGIARGGQIHAEATLILGTNDSSNKQIATTNEKQESIIEQYAKEEGVWVENINEKYGEANASGEESLVWYNADDKTATKSQSTNLYNDLQEKLDSITLHNFLFPETALEVIGFGRTSDGEFQVLVKQPFIVGKENTKVTDSQIEETMKDMGFERVEDNNYSNSETLVEDLHTGNAILTPNDKIAIIDPIIRLNTKEQGYGGKRDLGNNAVEDIIPPSKPTKPSAEKTESAKEKERTFGKRVLESEVSDEIKNGISEDAKKYIPISNKISVSEADYIIQEKGIQESVNMVLDFKNGLSPRVRVTLGVQLIKSLDKEGTPASYSQAGQVADELSKFATELGQGVQVFSLWDKLSADGVIQSYVRKQGESKSKIKEKHTSTFEGAKEGYKSGTKSAGKKATQNVFGKSKEKASKIKAFGLDKTEIEKRKKDSLEKLRKALKKGNLTSGGLNSEAIEAVVEYGAMVFADGVRNFKEWSAKIKEVAPELSEEDLKSVWMNNESFGGKTFDELSKISEIEDIVSDHFTKSSDADLLSKKLQDTFGLDKNLADGLATEITNEFNRIVKKERQVEISKKTPKLTKKVQQAIDEISEGENLSQTEIEDIIFKAFGIEKLTEEQSQKIRDLVKERDSRPEGFLRDEITRETLSYMASLNGIPKKDIFWSIYYASILSGYETQVLNIASNSLNIALESVVTSLEKVLIGKGSLKERAGAISEVYSGLLKGMKDGSRELSQILSTGHSARKIAQKLEAKDTLENVNFKGGKMNPLNYYKYVGRFMFAVDSAAFLTANGSKKQELAREVAQSEGLHGKAMRDRVSEILNESEQSYNEAKEQATQEIESIDNSAPKKMSERQKARLIKIRTSEIISEMIPDEIQEKANDYSSFVTYNYTPKGVLGTVASTLSGLGESVPAFKFVVPFTRVVANVLNQQLDYTPYGYLRASGFNFGAGMKNRTTAENINERNRILIKATLGTIAMTSLYVLAKSYEDDEDPYFEISGKGPSDMNKKNQLFSQGWRPYSIKIGDKRISYQYTPLGVALSFVGNWLDNEKYKELDKKDFLSKSAFAMKSSASGVMDMSFLTGLSGFFESLSKESDAEKTSENLQKTIGKIGTTFVPNLFKQLDKLYDPTIYDSKSIQASVLKEIPIVKRYSDLKPKLNAFGQPVEKQGNRFFQNVTNDTVWKFMAENRLFAPAISPNTHTIYGKEMSDNEFYEYVQKSGKLTYDYLKENMKDIQSTLNDLDGGEKQKYIDSMFKDFRKEVKYEIGSE
jgi:hypothetical protein